MATTPPETIKYDSSKFTHYFTGEETELPEFTLNLEADGWFILLEKLFFNIKPTRSELN